MSIRKIVYHAAETGQLIRLEPRPARAPRIRSMYLTEELAQSIYATSLPTADIERLAALEATLGSFITSKTIDPEYLFLLHPTDESVWEIRAIRPDPSIRVFGFFAYQDTFIATNYDTRLHLDAWESEAWIWAKMKARYAWRRIFNALQPASETDVKLLVTGALDGKYFK